MDLVFTGRVVEWRGPSPYYYLPVPADEAAEIRAVAALASYGWGVVPVRVRLGTVDFTTSLFPKDGGYLVPLKDAVRRPLGIEVGDDLTVELTVTFADRR